MLRERLAGENAGERRMDEKSNPTGLNIGGKYDTIGLEKNEREGTVLEVDYKEIGRRIKNVRKKKCKSQADLVKYMDVSVSYISQLEHGVTRMSLNNLYDIA